jgi:hypothetical protein
MTDEAKRKAEQILGICRWILGAAAVVFLIISFWVYFAFLGSKNTPLVKQVEALILVVWALLPPVWFFCEYIAFAPRLCDAQVATLSISRTEPQYLGRGARCTRIALFWPWKLREWSRRDAFASWDIIAGYDIWHGYPTDLTDTQWAFLAPLIPPAKVGGRPRSTDMREVVNAVFYVLRGGCQWRLLPKDFPPYQTVYDYFRS